MRCLDKKISIFQLLQAEKKTSRKLTTLWKYIRMLPQEFVIKAFRQTSVPK